VAAGTAAGVLVLRRVAPHVPAGLLLLASATVFVAATHLPVRLVGKVDVDLSLPVASAVDRDDVVSLLGPAAAIALLVFSSSVLAARALAERAGDRANANGELRGLGAANLAAGLLGGFPCAASDSRSGVLATVGARTRLAGVFTAVLVVLTILFLLPLFSHVPRPALAGVVIATALALIEVTELQRLWRVRRADLLMSLVTFGGVLAFGVLGGISVGVVVSLLDVLRRAVQPNRAVLGMMDGTPTYRAVDNYPRAETLPGLLVYRFDAPLFFANADVLRDELLRLAETADPPVREVVVDAEGMNDLDTTGVVALERVAAELRKRGARFSMARVRTSVRELMRRTGLEDEIGPENFHLRVEGAARAFLDRNPSHPPPL
jgi:SulP family sulfate permease